MMNLKNYEKEVLKLFLTDRINSDVLDELLSVAKIYNYEFTGAGYFLEAYLNGLNFEKETISEPLVVGEFNNIHVGFILYVDKDTVTMECHGWGDKNPPENIREINLKLRKGKK